MRVDEAELVYLADGPSGPSGPADIALAAGDTARLTVTVGTHAGAELALEAHLISPWGTWEWIGPAALGAVLPARGTRRTRLRRDPSGLVGTRPVVGPGPGRLRRPAALLAGGAGDGDMSAQPVATVAGAPVPVDEVDAAEARLRDGPRGPRVAGQRHQRGAATAALADPTDRDRAGGGRRGGRARR